MTKTITVQDCEEIIDRLADKTLSFGCEIEHKKEGRIIFLSQKYCQKKEHDSEYGCTDPDYCNNLACFNEDRIIYGNTWTPYTVLGHPVRIGDVLERVEFDGELLYLWRKCGPSQSLQEILAEAEKETGYIFDGQFCQSDCNNETEVITGPAAELFVFLKELL